jgi:hypothetical protein
MKQRLALSIALIVSVFSLSLVSSNSTARAQQRQRCTADTGVITLGPNQKLRVVVTGMGGNDATTVRFRRMQYAQGACNGGVCKLASVTDLILDPVTLMPGEAALMDITPMPGSSGVRAVVLSNRRNVRATAAIIDTVTGETTSTSLLDTMEEDECGL